MHKARENSDGSFSIGKTWMLDDLSAIQSYSAYVPKTPFEQQQKEWASTVGFVVTIGKPYYWHARSSKEKEFFIGSLVKIFKKYTGGRVPELIGFDERERQMLSGSTSGASTPSAAPVPPGSRGAGPDPSPESPVPATSAPGSRDPGRHAARQIRRRPSEDPALRTQKSREQMSRPSTGNKPAPPPFGTTNQPSALAPAQREPKSKVPSATFLQTADESAPSIEAKSLSSQPSKDGLRPTTPGSSTSETRGITASPRGSIGQKSPYREVEKAPQLDVPIRSSQDTVAADTLPTTSAEEPKPAPPNEPDVPSSPIAVDPAVVAAVVATEEPAKPSSEATTEAPPVTSPERTEEGAETHRPGLGPMIKKKSNKDIAGAFRKAANAYGAFKPRPGGAGERLLAAAKKQQAEEAGPNGITGVVPAPSLTRSPNEAPRSSVEEAAAAAATTEGAMATAKEAPATLSPAGTTPTVEITQHAAEESSEATLPEPERSQDSLAEISKLDDRSRTPSPAGQGRRRRRREDHNIKYCQVLGIEPSVLDGRGIEFDDILTDLGWNGRLSDEQKIEDLEADVRREIGRVEATSWLGNLEQQEGKVEQLAVLIDKTMEECEELEGLLTLYSHELNVSYFPGEFLGYRSADFMTVHRLSTRMSLTLKRSLKVCRCRLPTRSFSKMNCRIF